MPIRNRDDAYEVESHIAQFFDATAAERPGVLRRLFEGVLDFQRESGQLSLAAARERAGIELPPAAERIASLDGIQVVFVALADTETDRVRRSEAVAVAKQVQDELGEDMLLLLSNRSGNQLHWIHPQFGTSATPTLRRIVVERGVKQRTAVEQLSNIYWSYQKSGNILDALNEAFDVEPVTREFFREYKRIFEQASELITGFADDEERKQFVQTLFNRLMFVYFLSRKGWLTFKEDKDYLNALWRDYESDSSQDNFFDSRLYWLFFFGLNNPEGRDFNRHFEDRFMASQIGTVPFLNGGLFEETELDERDGIVVPDDAIQPLLTELFDKFNFTVMESTAFDIEVAVDPEMLGKVFEELVTGRHDSGAYYTPRSVVSFMCREALKGYLESRAPKVPAETIAAFVDDHETEGIGVNGAQQLASALAEVTVVDPACGSGAYLVGMMQELVELQQTLFNVGVDSKSLYELKLHIIERNLHGVDLDPFAVNIAMLRLWLSLAIEFEGDQPEPLPNLDFKIVEGDSLLGPDPSETGQQGVLGYDGNKVSELRDLKSQYMTASEPGAKEDLRKKITNAESAIRDQMSHFAGANNALDWRIDFAEVIADGGFDIAIANPPYVESRSSSVDPTLKDAYLTRVKDDWGVSLPRGSDLLMYFFAKAAGLIASTGRAVFITQNAWLNTDYGYAFQQFSLGRFSFSQVIDSEGKFFDSSAGPQINAIICSFSKQPVGRIDYGMADASLRVSTIKSIVPKSKYKWGTLFAMPDSLGRSLTALEGATETAVDVRIGQGLNFPKRELNCRHCVTPLFLGHGDFSAATADATGPPVGSKRARRIPALMMPRGIGDRHFCTFNACRAFSYSGVEVYLTESLWLSDTHYCLWLFLNSSLVWLFREVTGRKNLGGGMLKAEATDMKRLPICFAWDFGADARQIYDDLKERQSLPIRYELKTPEHLRIDAIVGEFFDVSDAMPEMREDLARLVKFRSDRSSR